MKEPDTLVCPGVAGLMGAPDRNAGARMSCFTEAERAVEDVAPQLTCYGVVHCRPRQAQQ